MMVVFGAVMWFTKRNQDDSLIVIISGATFAAVVVAYVLGQVLLRARIINSEEFTPHQYALIADELRGRGVKGTSRFIREHPEHVRYAFELTCALGLDRNPWATKAYEIESLVYVEDHDPARTADLIRHIIADRGITNREEIRRLLHTLLNTKEAIMSGAL